MLAGACQTEEEEFDESALRAVDEYVAEMTEEILHLVPDLLGWVREPYEDDLPLRYDQESREWLKERSINIEEIKRKHLTVNFPSSEDISGWNLVLVRSGKEWFLEGRELNDALGKLDSLVSEIEAVIEKILSSEGELDLEQSERVLTLVEAIEPMVDEVRSVLHH